ncbi:MAG: hypothetical protein ABGZ17_11880, partial [Planctomycetaceae bacterium]
MNPQPPNLPNTKHLWLCSFLLILGANSSWLTDSVIVVEVPQECQLAPTDQWFPPLTQLSHISITQHFPYVAFAAVVGLFIAVACRRLAASISIPFVYCGLAGLSLSVEPLFL